MDALTSEPHLEVTETRRWMPSQRTLIASSVGLAAGIAGALWISAPATSQTTDNAYVAADSTAVAPKIRGLVADVLVRDNETVRAGQPLVRIDPEEYDARVTSMRGALAHAEAGVKSAQAAIRSLDAEQRLSVANVAAAQTAIRSADALSEVAAADRRRYAALVKTGAVARRDADTVSAAAISAQGEASRVRALLTVSQEGASVTAAKRAGLLAALATARADVAQARAVLALALQDQQHATVTAPVAGAIGNRQVRRGDYVQPGTRLLTIVPLHDQYVTANFKETQTGRMRPGQAATIEVDALPGSEFKGVVDSIAPGSGSSFALLPFEPGTGNFTKVVQRLAVKIRFFPDQPGVEKLRPGLSVTAKVRLDQ